MELKDLKKKTVKELNSLLAKSREQLRDLRFKDSSKQLKNVKEIKKVRKLISQILTLINQNRIAKQNISDDSDNKEENKPEAKK